MDGSSVAEETRQVSGGEGLDIPKWPALRNWFESPRGKWNRFMD